MPLFKKDHNNVRDTRQHSIGPSTLTSIDSRPTTRTSPTHKGEAATVPTRVNSTTLGTLAATMTACRAIAKVA